jgi:hypothetical protein
MFGPTRGPRGSGQEDALEVATGQADATRQGADRPTRIVGLAILGGEHGQPCR